MPVSLEQFQQQFRAVGMRVPSPATIRTYSEIIGKYITYLDDQNPTPDTQRDFVEIMAKVSATRAYVARNALRSYHRVCKVEQAEINVSMPYSKHEFLTFAQVVKMRLSVRTPTESAIISVLYDTAIRAGELLRLRWKDIDLLNGFEHVQRKGGREEDIPLWDMTSAALAELHEQQHPNPEDKVFALDYNRLYAMVRDIGLRAGVKCHPHDLRHARASHLRQQQVPLDRIQALLGHTNPAITVRYYAHITPHDLKKIPAGFR